MNTSNGIALDSLGIFRFNDFNIYSGDQAISINGDMSSLPEQQLQTNFKNFDISVFNILSPLMGNLSFGGQLNGKVLLNSYAVTPNILAALWLETFVFNGTTMGDLNIQSNWKTNQTVAVHAYLEKQGNKQAFLPFEVLGEYEPATHKIDAELKTWQLPLDFINPFLKGLVSNLKGKANGNAQITGTLLAPEIEGKIRLERSEFKIDYLNTTYALSGNLLIDKNSIGFKQTKIYDTLGNAAVLNGGLTHRYLSHFGVDLDVQADHFAALNTTANMNSLFYGNSIVSGDLSFKGPFDNIFMRLNLESNAGSQIFIPLNSTSDISDNEFIIFTNRADSTTTNTETTRQLSTFTLDMQLKVTPETEISISMPEDLGTINAKGSGIMDMSMSRTGNFNMSGDYTVKSGEFFFNMRNLFNRRFALEQGGNISWTGDPYDGRLNMMAAYHLKTSLNNFDNTGDSTQRTRVPVECIIGLKGKLTNPDLRFKVNLPNTTEDVRQYVYSQIDTTNQAQMSQQMLSLLILNSFNFSNSFENANNISSNMSGSTMQIFTNQLGNLLSNISDNVDVGINYVPGNNTGQDELEVALSTQLFDDRVSIDGNFGYKNMGNSSIQENNSNLIGDIVFEVKLQKDGNWRLKVFNKTNTVDLLDNTSPYTQGVGIFYRQSFNRFSDLFRRKRLKIETKEE
ncbi:MAG: hypothetical protein CR987_00300 [Draconibacterium sp.]|nr:MAG: hypothetical protein CR987_00300 [Draconibacterium sp.]